MYEPDLVSPGHLGGFEEGIKEGWELEEMLSMAVQQKSVSRYGVSPNPTFLGEFGKTRVVASG